MADTSTLPDLSGQGVPNLQVDAGPPSPPSYAPPDDDEGPGPEGVGDQQKDDGGEDGDDVRSEVEDVLEPYGPELTRVLMDTKGRNAAYTQKRLTYFGKIELYGLLGRAVQLLMDGDNGLGLDDVMGLADPRSIIDKMMARLPGAEDSPDRADSQSGIDEAAKMMGIFAKVVSSSPEMLLEAYCIILHVPAGQREWVTLWALPEMEDEVGDDVMNAFIDQNWGVLEDFFTQQLPRLFRRAAKARDRHRSATDRSRH